jgi:hypothetical protein
MTAASDALEQALRAITFAQTGGSPELYEAAARRVIDALDRIMAEEQFFEARGSDGSSPSVEQWRQVQQLLGDGLLDVMSRVNYVPPPEARQLLNDANGLVDQLRQQQQRVPAEVVDDCMTGLRRLRRKLHAALYPLPASEPAGTAVADTAAILGAAKPILVPVAVASGVYFRADNELPPIVRREAAAVATELAVTWMYCFDARAFGQPGSAPSIVRPET